MINNSVVKQERLNFTTVFPRNSVKPPVVDIQIVYQLSRQLYSFFFLIFYHLKVEFLKKISFKTQNHKRNSIHNVSLITAVYFIYFIRVTEATKYKSIICPKIPKKLGFGHPLRQEVLWKSEVLTDISVVTKLQTYPIDSDRESRTDGENTFFYII